MGAVLSDVCFGGIREGSQLVESLGSEDGVELDYPGASVIGEEYEGLEVCAPSGVSNWKSGGNLGKIHWEEYLVQRVGGEHGKDGFWGLLWLYL